MKQAVTSSDLVHNDVLLALHYNPLPAQIDWNETTLMISANGFCLC